MHKWKQTYQIVIDSKAKIYHDECVNTWFPIFENQIERACTSGKIDTCISWVEARGDWAKHQFKGMLYAADLFVLKYEGLKMQKDYKRKTIKFYGWAA